MNLKNKSLPRLVIFIALLGLAFSLGKLVVKDKDIASRVLADGPYNQCQDAGGPIPCGSCLIYDVNSGGSMTFGCELNCGGSESNCPGGMAGDYFIEHRWDRCAKASGEACGSHFSDYIESGDLGGPGPWNIKGQSVVSGSGTYPVIDCGRVQVDVKMKDTGTSVAGKVYSTSVDCYPSTPTPTPTTTPTPTPTTTPDPGTYMKVCKYEDDNGNGNIESEDEIISWYFRYTLDQGSENIVQSDARDSTNQGCAKVNIPSGKSIRVWEEGKTNWSLTKVYVNGSKVDSSDYSFTSSKGVTNTIWFLNHYYAGDNKSEPVSGQNPPVVLGTTAPSVLPMAGMPNWAILALSLSGGLGVFFYKRFKLI